MNGRNEKKNVKVKKKTYQIVAYLKEAAECIN